MKKLFLLPALLLLVFAGCKQPAGNAGAMVTFINQSTMDKVIKRLTDSCGDQAKFRIDRGVKQAAALWKKEDGTAEEFTKFCTSNFISDTTKLHVLFTKLQDASEVLYGNFNKMALTYAFP